MIRPFAPVFGQTVSISATTTSANVALATGLPQGEFQMRVYNAGTDTVYVNFGDSTAAAATTDHIVPSGAVEVITINNPAKSPITYAAAKAASSTATVYFTPGHGL